MPRPLPLLCAGLTLLFAATPLMSAVDMSGYERVWSDDFSEPTLNADNWTYDAGVGVWNTEANKELQYYTDSPRNIRIEDGAMVIEAHRESVDVDRRYQFTSARVKSSGRMNFQYGILKARLRLPDLSGGFWPAFWTLGDVADGWPQGGEIDIMEGGHSSLTSAGIVNQSALGVVHWCFKPELVTDPWNYHAYYPSPYGTPPSDPIYCTVDSLQDWHVWTMVWSAGLIEMYVDDQESPYFRFEFDPEEMTEFTQPQAVLFNLAVGGAFPNILTPQAVTATLPARMEVDYVEVWQKPGEGRLYSAGAEGTRLTGNVAIGELAEGTDGTVFDTRVPFDDSFGFIYSWNNLDVADGTSPNEGSKSLLFTVPNAGDWYGGGFQTLSNFLNFERFTGGYVVVDVKTSAMSGFRLGIGSLTTGNGELAFEPGEEKFGLVRDGQWHTVRIPVGAFGGSVDLATVNVLFYLVSAAPGEAFSMEIDNLYWEEADAQPTPENGSYGILTNTAANKTAGEVVFGEDVQLFIWEDTLVDGPVTAPSEGGEVWSLTAPGGWFGLGVFCNQPLNLTAFEHGYLNFDLKTSSSTPFYFGLKSEVHDKIGQIWIRFDGPGNDPYGFVRDGEWHTVSIPMQDLAAMGNLNLYEVVQVFELLGVNGGMTFAVDNIYFSGGGEARRDRWSTTDPTGEGYWAGFPIVDEAGNVDTGDFIGWLNCGTSDYVWNYSLGTWMYLPEAQVTPTGAWSYIFNMGQR